MTKKLLSVLLTSLILAGSAVAEDTIVYSGPRVIGGDLTVQGEILILNAGETLSIADLTEGSILFVGPGGLITQDSAKLVWNDSLNRAGIGTNNPRSILHIKGSTSGTVGDNPAGQLIIQDPSLLDNTNICITGYNSDIGGNPKTQKWYFGSSSSSNQDVIILNRAAANLHFGTSGASKMVINSDGDVGIGTNVPTSKLQVVGLPQYADNAAALLGGLTVGAFYRNATGTLMVVY